MNKVELVKKISEGTGYSAKSVKEVIDAFDGIVLASMEAGEDVKTGIVTFAVKDTVARVGRNPKTGETVNIPAGKKVAVKLSKALKESVK